MDALHRILTGQPLTPRELRIAGWIVVAWFLHGPGAMARLADRQIPMKGRA
jgi:hypothetical protein